MQLWSFRTRDVVALPETKLELFSARVEGHTLKRAMSRWNEEFAHGVHLVSVSGGRLRLEELTVFTDGSGRSNYVSTGVFRRVGQ
jgi:hypothetical protein